MNGSPATHADNLQLAYKRALRDLSLQSPLGTTDRSAQSIHDYYNHLFSLLQTKGTLREFFEASIPYLIQEKRRSLVT